MTKLNNGMLLDAKVIIDNSLPDLRDSLDELIPPALKEKFYKVLSVFEDDLASCDVSSNYEEINWDYKGY